MHTRKEFRMRLVIITKQRTNHVPLSTNVVHVSRLARVMSYRITLDGRSQNMVSQKEILSLHETIFGCVT